MQDPLYAWRCRLITVDHETYEYDKQFEPVRTLRKNRMLKTTMQGLRPVFGIWIMRANDGEIQVGDEVKIISTKASEVKTKDEAKKLI